MGRKWSPPSKVFAVLGVVFALAAFSIIRGYAARARRMSASLGGPVAVQVTAHSLPRGSVLTSAMLIERTYPSSYAPPGAVHRPKDAVSRVLLTSMAAKEKEWGPKQIDKRQEKLAELASKTWPLTIKKR